MTEYDWNDAPKWATHVLTTGPKWDGRRELAGTFEWVGVDHWMHAMGSDAWIVHEARPAADIKPQSWDLAKCVKWVRKQLKTMDLDGVGEISVTIKPGERVDIKAVGADDWETPVIELPKAGSMGGISGVDPGRPMEIRDWQELFEYGATVNFAVKPTWDGQGLPPVGVECEVLFEQHSHKGYGKFIILGREDDYFWLKYIGPLENNGKCYCAHAGELHFRPIRTERDEAIQAMHRAFYKAKQSPTWPDGAPKYIIDSLDASKVPGYGQTGPAKEALGLLNRAVPDVTKAITLLKSIK